MSKQVTIELADDWSTYLDGLISDRRYESVDHAIEHALRLLEAVEDKEDRLTRLLEEGEREAGFEEWDYERFKTEMRRSGDDRKAA